MRTQRERTSYQINPHDNAEDHKQTNNEILTREDRFSSIRRLLDSKSNYSKKQLQLTHFILEITKENGPGGLGGVEDSPSKSIANQLNYAKTAKHVDLKLLNYELKREIESRLPTLSIDFQSVLKSLGRRLSEEVIDQGSKPYYFIALLHLCNENHWELQNSSLSTLIVNIQGQ